MSAAASRSVTDRVRHTFLSLIVLTVLAALAGWIFYDRDPAKLAPILGFLVVGAGVGEASNVGKRATFKAEAVTPAGS